MKEHTTLQYAGSTASRLEDTVQEQGLTIGRQDAELGNLSSLVNALQDIVLGIINTRVLLSGTGGVGGTTLSGPCVSLATFNMEKASHIYHRSILEQTIGGSDIKVGRVTLWSSRTLAILLNPACPWRRRFTSDLMPSCRRSSLWSFPQRPCKLRRCTRWRQRASSVSHLSLPPLP